MQNIYLLHILCQLALHCGYLMVRKREESDFENKQYVYVKSNNNNNNNNQNNVSD